MSNARSRMGAYGRIPKALLRDGTISARAKAAVAMIDEVAGHETVTMELLAEWLGCTLDTARKALHEARDAGWVEIIERRDGGRQIASEYVANGSPHQTDTAPEKTGGRPSENWEGGLVENGSPRGSENWEGIKNETYETNEKAPQAEPPRKRATRIPEEWEPDEELVSWAAEKSPAVDLEAESFKFRNYWLAKSGKDATKLDWRRTWQNWILTAAERLPRAAQGVHPVSPPTEVQQEAQRLWLEARGSSIKEYDQRKTEPGWMDGMRAKKVRA